MKAADTRRMGKNTLALAGVALLLFSVLLPARALAATDAGADADADQVSEISPSNSLDSAAADEELATAKLLAQKMSTQMRAEFSYRLNQVRFLKGYHVDDLNNFAGNGSALTGDFASSRQGELSEGHTQRISRPTFEKVYEKADGKPDFNKAAGKAGAQNSGTSNARLGATPPESMSPSPGGDLRASPDGESRAPATVTFTPAYTRDGATTDTPIRNGNAGSTQGEAPDGAHASRDGSYANLVKDEKPEFFRAVDDGKRAAAAKGADPLRELEKLPTPQAIARLKKDKSMRELLRERLLSGELGEEPADVFEQFRQLLSSVDASPDGLNQSGLSLFEVVHRKYLDKSPVFQPHGGGPGKQ